MNAWFRRGGSLLLVAALTAALPGQSTCYTSRVLDSIGTVVGTLTGVAHGATNRTALFVVETPFRNAQVEVRDSSLSSANLVAQFTLEPAAPSGAGGRFSLINLDPNVLALIETGTTWLRVNGRAAPILPDRGRQFQFDLPGGALFAIFDLKPGRAEVFFRKVGVPNQSALPPFEFVMGSVQSPGSVLEQVDLLANGRKSFALDTATSNAIASGNAFVRPVAAPTLAAPIVELVDEKRVMVGSTDGVNDNAIGFFTRQPGNTLAGTVRTASFPATVTAVNVFENGTNASYGQTFPIGGGEFLLPPVQPLTPAMIQSYEQNNMIVELVTAGGTFAATISDSAPPFVLGVGTPGLNGVVPFAEFTTQALIAYGYTLQLSDADAGALAIPILGFELHDPPVFLTALGLDDTVYVKQLVTLPLTFLDATGGAFWQQPLPNDTTFTGLPLLSQVAVLSGTDGLSMSTLTGTTIGPN